VFSADENFLSKVVQLDDFNFDYQVNSKFQTKADWLIYFYLTQCEICEGYDQLWDDLSQRKEEFTEGNMMFGKVCIDSSPLVSKKLKIDRAPITILVKNGYFYMIEAPLMPEYYLHFINSNSFRFARSRALPIIAEHSSESSPGLSLLGAGCFAVLCVVFYRGIKRKLPQKSE
jgi:hypothetical protein